ncbi:MAG: PCRF domain-containing protein, partial [Thiobacillus sp.]|nr:PCRF domain-containing protein [Thiobacillus sp.]
MKASLADKLARADERLEELDALLSQPEIAGDMDRYRKLTREHADLTPVVALYRTYKELEADQKSARGMLEDPDMRELAEAELADCEAKIGRLETELQTALLPKDPNDERNIFLEIRAGTGGDESALFAGNLLRMYTRYAERCGWKVEIVSDNPGEVGGYKEAIIRIVGHGAYSRLKFESGGHRVQREPETETQGRIHTSACTVAVMPEVDEV